MANCDYGETTTYLSCVWIITNLVMNIPNRSLDIKVTYISLVYVYIFGASIKYLNIHTIFSDVHNQYKCSLCKWL